MNAVIHKYLFSNFGGVVWMVKQIIFRVSDELKDIGDMVFKLTGENQQDVLQRAYTDYIYRTIGFLPGNDTLVKKAYEFATHEHEKVVRDFERKYFSVLSSDSNIKLSNDSKISKENRNRQNDPRLIASDSKNMLSNDSNKKLDKIREIVDMAIERGDSDKMRSIFGKLGYINGDNFDDELLKIKDQIFDCIPFEIENGIDPLDFLIDLRFFL